MKSGIFIGQDGRLVQKERISYWNMLRIFIFDEVQFDYVRFPSDGNLKAIKYPVYDGKRPMADVMRDFF